MSDGTRRERIRDRLRLREPCGGEELRVIGRGVSGRRGDIVSVASPVRYGRSYP